MSTLLPVIVLAPLVGAAINGFFGRKLPKVAAGPIGVIGPLISLVCSCLVFKELWTGTAPVTASLGTWFDVGALNVTFGLKADALAGIMLLIITGIGTLIHVYSIEYMKADAGIARFFAYLNLFMFAMLTLVLGDSLVLMFLGWEGVGLCSYLLIGFWWEEGKNADAGKKAFIVNRIGDFGFLLGIFFLFGHYGTVNFAELAAAIAQKPELVHLLWIPAGLLFLGACGKSAQIPLYVWLPDAMAGPTPVSALIHAATMVTAGVYMVARMHFLYALLPGDVLHWGVLIGASTALLAAIIAVAQTDIKKVLAYSTVSQLGFMFCGMASTQFETGIFHVMTHAFFKALLFLGAGAVIHALHNEQDIRKMGGLRKELPVLAAVFIIGSLALAGFPGFAGFFSKDAILAAVYEQSIYPVFGMAWIMLLLTALLTAFYSTRLFCVVFLGEKQPTDHVEGHAAPHGGIHKPGLLMMAPLVILAALSIGGGFIKGDVTHFLEKTYAPAAGDPKSMEWIERHHPHEAALLLALEPKSPEMAERIERAEKAEHRQHAGHVLNQRLSVFVFVIGFIAAYFLYLIRREWAAKLIGNPIHTLIYNKFYVDEIYHWTIVAPLRMGAAMLWFVVDRLLIDTVLVNGAGWVSYKLGSGVGRLHRGSIAAGAAFTALGAALILWWLVH